MNKQRIKISFFFRISQGAKRRAKGIGRLTYILSQGGKQIVERSTDLVCNQFQFDYEIQKFVGENARELNMELVRVKEKVTGDVAKYLNDGDSRILFKGFSYDTIEFKKELKPLTEVMDEYIAFQSAKIRQKGEKKHIGNIEVTTFNTYKIRRDVLMQYMKKLSPKIIKLKDVDVMYLENYNVWLTTTKTWQGKSRGQEYANKCIKFVKTVMKYATTAGYMYHNVTENYRNKRASVKPVRTLSSQDIEKLENCQILTEKEVRVIDVFLFAKETFLHIGDFQDLKSEHIKTDKDGHKWIVKDRIKSQEEGVQVQRVPLTQKALEILEKYGTVEDMPSYCDGSFNRHLKIAAEKAGIQDNITFKMARSSGISEAYNEKSLRAESIAVCAGWSTTRELKTYLQVDYGQLKNEFTQPLNALKNASMFQI